jgi:hypothetical protein
MHRYVSLSAVAVVLLIPIGVRGQEKEKPQAGTDKLEKKVVDIVKQTGDLYKNAKSFTAEGTIVSKVTGDGEDQNINVTATYAVEKPKHFAVKTKMAGDPKKGPDIIADGKNLIIYRKALNQYTEQAAPDTLADIGLSLLRIGPANTGMLFANILAEDPADLLMQGVNSCSYVGTEKIDGTPAHRMKFSQNEFDWELWVAAEGKPYILRMSSSGEGPHGKFSTVETYKNWKLDAAPAKDTFTFTAPKDAKKVTDFERIPQR